MNKYSIILPIYNGERYVHQCLFSIVNQSYKNTEILIINDGSTDDTERICIDYLNKDNRIKYFYKKNEGVSIARNFGISRVTGDYILFIDCDDVLPLDCISLYNQHLNNADFDYIIGSYEYIRFNKVIRSNLLKDEILDKQMFFENIKQYDNLISTVWGKVYKSNIILRNHIFFESDMSYGEDNSFNLDYLNFANKIYITEKKVYKYRLGGVASSIKYHENMNHICKKMYDKYESCINDRIFLQQMFMKLEYVAIDHYLYHCDKVTRKKKIEETIKMFKGFSSESDNTQNYYKNYFKTRYLKIIRAKLLIKIRKFIRI